MADDDERDDKKPKKSGVDRIPADLGVHGALEQLGVYLTLPRGYRVSSVVRHGRDSDDPMTVYLIGLGDDQPSYAVRFARQKEALRGGTLRAVFGQQTDGQVRVPYYAERDATEVFLCMCLAAGELTAEDSRAETRTWIEETARNAAELHGFTLHRPHRFDLLAALVSRPLFDRRAAMALIGWREDTPGTPLRPTLIVDREDGFRYLRVSEAITYVRHLLGPPPLAQKVFTARLAEIGVRWLQFDERRGRVHHASSFYLLPELEAE